MSKKKFKKFKKKHSHGHQYQPPVQVSPAQVETQDAPPVKDKPIEVEKVEAKTAPMLEETEAEKKEYGYVRGDVKKILIVIGSVFVLLIAAYFVNLKTPLFHTMGDWLYKALNIQTQ